jgi:hypothetical protein
LPLLSSSLAFHTLHILFLPSFHPLFSATLRLFLYYFLALLLFVFT